MSRPHLLDLFCKAGGASKGYMEAGFCVVGVDIQPQPRYVGHAFYQADALEFVAKYGREFDAIAASPPCQLYTTNGNKHRHRGSGRALDHPDLIGPTRRAMEATGRLDGRRLWTRVDGSELRAPRTLAQAQAALGIDWMTWDELTQAIPPAYTRYIGKQMIRTCFPGRTIS